MHSNNKLQLEINKLEEVREKQHKGELNSLQCQLARENISQKIVNILMSETFIFGN